MTLKERREVATDQNLPANPQPTKSKAVAASVTGGATVTTAALAKDSEVCTTGFHSCNFSPRLSQVEEEESQGEDRRRLARPESMIVRALVPKSQNLATTLDTAVEEDKGARLEHTSSKSSSTKRTSHDKPAPREIEASARIPGFKYQHNSERTQREERPMASPT